MTSQSQPFQHIIAFEVAKNSLTLHVLPADRQEIIANTPVAVRRALRRELKLNAKIGLGPILVVCEATGGYERHVLAEASALGLALHRAHGVRTRYFARYLGLAKTDPIDARMLALYGRDTPNLRLYAPPEPQQAALTALRKRQDDLKAVIRMETNRLEHARHPGVVSSSKASIRMLTRDKERLDGAIDQLVKATPQMARKAQLMQSLKGVGPATATACLAYLPELGSFTKGQVARIVGLAPIANDSPVKPRFHATSQADAPSCARPSIWPRSSPKPTIERSRITREASGSAESQTNSSSPPSCESSSSPSTAILREGQPAHASRP